jgi:hypothetical protein
MKRLLANLALLIIVLALFFNVERMDIGGENTVNIQSFVYGLGMVAVLSVLLIPIFRRAHVLIAVITWLVVYFLLRLTFFDDRPLVGDGLVYLTITEITFLVILVLVSHLASHSVGEFENAVKQLTLAEDGQLLEDLDSGRESIHTEITRSRYYERPISVLVIIPDRATMQSRLAQMIGEMQQKISALYSKARLARLVRKELRLMDQIYLDRHSDNLVVLCPEIDAEAAAQVVKRVQSVMDREEIEAQIGWASFPDDGLTFDRLLAHSEESIHREREAPANDSGDASPEYDTQNLEGSPGIDGR